MMEEKLGMRMKRFREKKEISLEELSERTGLDAAFLRNVEDEEMYPSLGPLLKISRALGVRLGTFLDDHAGDDPLIVRLGEREEEISMMGGKDKAAALKFYSLGRGKSDRHMEPFFIELFPVDNDGKKLSSHEGEEFIIVNSGEVEITYGRETHLLKQGDSIYLNSVVPHLVRAAGDAKAEIYAVLYFPQ